ncbi:hypothetical protein [Sphingomonas faeni]|uniref:hypothetical protein n=1 Tax=Sphingomonas faeni TaxID=185950 RepID=UPI0020C7940E|nr:hypothetical protein [Sphingomonas faeni]MCP8892034.1 hypothetical protein [Sphingomonas faeni]
MIMDVPTSVEFHTAGLNQLYLAWEIAMRTVREFDGAMEASAGEESAPPEYWQRVQPALANAFSLIQQGMELALKGRIADVSPFLLVGRDPRDWPRGVDSGDVSFGEFHTLNASDLVKVHNSVITPRFDEPFKDFWEQVRQDRNRIMLSTSRPSFEAGDVVRTILTAIEALYHDMPWPQRLLAFEGDGKFTVFGFVDDVRNNVMREVDDAQKLLTTAEKKRFFGIDSKRHAYVCPKCYYDANRDWQDDWPRLAQLVTKTPGETGLRCIVCATTTTVDRDDCSYARCPGNVLFEDLCLTCMRSQCDNLDVPSALVDNCLGPEHRYEFVFGQGSQAWGGDYISRQHRLLDDDRAKDYAALALANPHLARWETVSIFHKQTGVFPLRSADDRAVGYWLRDGGHLHWYGSASAYQPERDGPV